MPQSPVQTTPGKFPIPQGFLPETPQGEWALKPFLTMISSPQPKPHPLLLKHLLAEDGTVPEIDAQFVERAHVGLEIEDAADEEAQAVVRGSGLPAGFGQSG
jgi:hypothetical protein